MKVIRNISFLVFVGVFALASPGNVKASECGCDLLEEGETGEGEPWAFYDCFSSSYCDSQKVDCAEAYCGEDAVDWGETYCGNGNLLVTCDLIG